MLMNVKMPIIVGILTLISRVNTSSESLRARKVFIFHHFCFYEQLKFLIFRSKFFIFFLSSADIFFKINFFKKIFLQ